MVQIDWIPPRAIDKSMNRSGLMSSAGMKMVREKDSFLSLALRYDKALSKG